MLCVGAVDKKKCNMVKYLSDGCMVRMLFGFCKSLVAYIRFLMLQKHIFLSHHEHNTIFTFRKCTLSIVSHSLALPPACLNCWMMPDILLFLCLCVFTFQWCFANKIPILNDFRANLFHDHTHTHNKRHSKISKIRF